jgi:hypothetical protein
MVKGYLYKVMENTKKTVNWEKFNKLRVPSHPFYHVDDFWAKWDLVKVGTPECEDRFKVKTLAEWKEKNVA